MFCSKCGKENTDDAKFCVECGAPLVAKTQVEPAKKTRKMVPVLIILAVVIVAAGGIGFKLYRDSKDKKNRDEYVRELEDRMDELEDEKEKYIFSDSDEEDYDKICDDIRDAIDDGEKVSELKERKKNLESFFTDLAEANQKQIDEKVAELEGADIEFAFDDELETIDTCKADIQNYLSAKNYAAAWNSACEWDEAVQLSNCDFTQYSMTVRQYDLSAYPTVNLYVDVEDQNGNFVDNLDTSAFFVNEGRTLNGKFDRTAVINAVKLNENEGISIGLVADVSGSMDGNMDDAKHAMNSFVDSVQFDKGDELELILFDEQSYICQAFTDQKSQITSAIQNMTVGGRTRLYDTLINEVARIQSCENAKCIIGFTDGLDNESQFGPQDVIDAAVEANVPIFLIGIGSECDSSTLRRISEATGGRYQDIDGIDSLQSIYDSIYREQKEVYQVTYKVSDEDNFDDPCYANIYVRSESGVGGMVEEFSFEPSDFFQIMYNKFLVAGIDCQTKGERNLLDSGLIITTDKAYKNKDCVAYQSQQAIDSGGVGSDSTSTFEVLIDYDVLDVVKDGDGYIVYGMAEYDVSKERKYSNIKSDLEKDYIDSMYGSVDKNDTFWIEENLTNYEKLTLIKDSDGKWKFNTRVYEREDGGKSVVFNEVYQAIMQ